MEEGVENEKQARGLSRREGSKGLQRGGRAREAKLEDISKVRN